MRDFVGFATNGEFSVGCTGQTVYLYDKDNNEITKFKDMKYAYAPSISPDGKFFVVKSTEGRLAVYSLETLSLIKKFRFSRVNYSQDDGFCFSPDGSKFLNIEQHGDGFASVVSVYNTADFSLEKQIATDEYTTLCYIEYDESTATYYILGYRRNKEHIFSQGFVARLEDGAIRDMVAISKNEYDFYFEYKGIELLGFATKGIGLAYTPGDLEKLRAKKHTLAKIYSYRSAK